MQSFVGLDAKAVQRIFTRVEEKRLKSILKSISKDFEFVPEKEPKELVQLAVYTAESYGIKELVTAINKADVKQYCEIFDIPVVEESKAPSKAYLSKRLTEDVANSGLNEVFKGISEKHVQSCLEVLGIDKKRDGRGYLEDIIREMGVQIFLSKLSVDVLQNLCSDLKISVDSSSVSQLVSAITTGKAPEKREVSKEAHVLSKKKPSLKKGVKAADVYQYYFKPELTEFCQEHGLKVSGTSKELIARIIEYLEGSSKENTSTGSNTKSKKEDDDNNKEETAEEATAKRAKSPARKSEKKPETEKSPKVSAKTAEKPAVDEAEEKEAEVAQKSLKINAKQGGKSPKNDSAKKGSKPAAESLDDSVEVGDETPVVEKKKSRAKK